MQEQFIRSQSQFIKTWKNQENENLNPTSEKQMEKRKFSQLSCPYMKKMKLRNLSGTS